MCRCCLYGELKMIYLEVLFIEILFFTLLFIIGTKLKNNGVVDSGWGSGFVLIINFVFFTLNYYSLKNILITILITIWGIRLTWHITRRNYRKPEDYRYQEFRNNWPKKFQKTRFYLQIYLVQALLQYLIIFAAIYGVLQKSSVTYFNYLGIILWFIGFYFEAYGDYQLKKFKAISSNKGKLMTKGLWSITRHPNYFGDALMWWGIYCLSFVDQTSLYTIFSPMLMTYLIVFVSGVKLLEKKYENRLDYQKYKQQTSSFIPWFKKKGE